ncbi:MAG: hypothetical protein KAT77_02575 [Nanoarchaeota archaeon]|nr:hypothetical protein [Nanoarchaeota archaeon]
MNINGIVEKRMEHYSHKIGLNLYTQGHQAVLLGDTKTLKETILNCDPKYRNQFITDLVKCNDQFFNVDEERIAKDAWEIDYRLRQGQSRSEVGQAMGIRLFSLKRWHNLGYLAPSLGYTENYLRDLDVQKYLGNQDCLCNPDRELDQQSTSLTKNSSF